ncbi:hypothetical protein FRB96_002622 [Tulasnella sp. 330]|nr:hypothetical protein FRB96_002622 [Tulasnella sp. 330]
MTTIVEIPGSSAEQLVETAAFPLGEGTFAVIINADAVTLRLPQLAFPLSPATPVLTHAHYPLWYFFKGPVGGSYVRITLPERCAVAGTPESELRDLFEEALMDAGFLITDIGARVDEIHGDEKEDAVWVNNWLTAQSEAYDDATTNPLDFSAAAMSVAASASSGSLAVAGYAASSAQAVGKGVVGVGNKFFSLFTGGNEGAAKAPDTSEKMHSDLTEAGYSDVALDSAKSGDTPSPHPFDLKPLVVDVKTAGSQISGAMSPVFAAAGNFLSSIKSSAGQVGSAAVGGVRSVVNHDYGARPTDLTGKTEQTASNAPGASDGSASPVTTKAEAEAETPE